MINEMLHEFGRNDTIDLKNSTERTLMQISLIESNEEYLF